MNSESNNDSGRREDENSSPERDERKAVADWCTKSEIATHFGVSLRTVTSLMQRRVLPFVKIGNLVRFNRSACDAAVLKFKRKSLYE